MRAILLAADAGSGIVLTLCDRNANRDELSAISDQLPLAVSWRSEAAREVGLNAGGCRGAGIFSEDSEPDRGRGAIFAG